MANFDYFLKLSRDFEKERRERAEQCEEPEFSQQTPETEDEYLRRITEYPVCRNRYTEDELNYWLDYQDRVMGQK